MRTVAALLALLLVACSPGEPENHTASADVDMDRVPAMLTALDALSVSALPVDQLIELTRTTPIDEEQQLRFPLEFAGRDTDMLYHVWREQEGWVHVYASSTTKGLIDAVDETLATFERQAVE